MNGARFAGVRIGLLGGSLNPAHEGHLHISDQALKRLGIDMLWWLVSPQNPLKTTAGMAAHDRRVKAARAMVRHPRIIVTGIEAELGTRFTADTLLALSQRFPRAHFIWIMGADNLGQIPAWDRWQAIFDTVCVAVFARPSYSLSALGGLAAARYRRYRHTERKGHGLADRCTRDGPPAWAFVPMPLRHISATEIRARNNSAVCHDMAEAAND